ncbi:MAG: hypothetical protein U1U88_001144 [Lawsonella clevelandensis]
MLLELTYEVFEDAHLPISEQRGHKVACSSAPPTRTTPAFWKATTPPSTPTL